jgi:hypothetical protein
VLFMPGPCNYARPGVPSLAFTLVERTILDDDGGEITIAVPSFEEAPVQANPDDIINRQSKVHGAGRGPDPAKTAELAIALVEFLKDKGPVFLSELFDEFGSKEFLDEQKWNHKSDRFEWSNTTALYRAAPYVQKLEPPHDGWVVITSKDNPSLRSLNGRARWMLQRLDF